MNRTDIGGMAQELRRTISPLKTIATSISLKGWLIYCIGSIAGFLVTGWQVHERWAGVFGAAYAAANIAASIYMLGVPFVISSALVMTEAGRRRNSDETFEVQPSPENRFLPRVTFLFMLNLFCVEAWTIFSYYVAAVEFTHILPLDLLTYLPAALFTGVLTSFFVTALTCALATAMDDWRLALATNLFLFIAMAWVFGISTYLRSPSTLPLWGLYHLHRFLALGLAAGIQDAVFSDLWTNLYTSGMIFGMPLSLPDLIPPTLTWVGISLILIPAMRSAYRRSLAHQRFRGIGVGGPAAPDAELKTPLLSDLDAARKMQRRIVAVGLILLILVVPQLNGFIVAQEQEESIQVLYQSPGGGEVVTLNVWRYDSVEFGPPPAGKYNWYGIGFEILDWHDSPHELKCRTIFREMGTDAFESLNQTERDALSGTTHLHINPDSNERGGGWCNIQWKHGQFLWGVKFQGSENEDASGHLRVRITVRIRTAT